MEHLLSALLRLVLLLLLSFLSLPSSLELVVAQSWVKIVVAAVLVVMFAVLYCNNWLQFHCCCWGAAAAAATGTSSGAVAFLSGSI
jgi:hypothetical protein